MTRAFELLLRAPSRTTPEEVADIFVCAALSFIDRIDIALSSATGAEVNALRRVRGALARTIARVEDDTRRGRKCESGVHPVVRVPDA